MGVRSCSPRMRWLGPPLPVNALDDVTRNMQWEYLRVRRCRCKCATGAHMPSWVCIGEPSRAGSSAKRCSHTQSAELAHVACSRALQACCLHAMQKLAQQEMCARQCRGPKLHMLARCWIAGRLGPLEVLASTCLVLPSDVSYCVCSGNLLACTCTARCITRMACRLWQGRCLLQLTWPF